MSNIPDSSSSSDDDYSSSGSSDMDLRSAGPEVFTRTLKQQLETEDSITSLFQMHNMLTPSNNFNMVQLKTERHIAFLRKGLFAKRGVSSGLHASQTWVVYWCLHGLSMLNAMPTDNELSLLVRFLKKCQNEDGAFGGGEDQISHLATSYAAVLSIALIGTPEAYALLDRAKFYRFLLSMKQPNGSFRMHEGGEIDVRASYIAAVCASLLNLWTPQLKENMASFVSSCQSYEGGIGSIPGAEAHGGYTFCGLAALVLIGDTSQINLMSLAEWAVQRQMTIEGGFQGRTNKLVDGCYSFWQGATFPLLDLTLVNPQMYVLGSDSDICEAWDENEGSWLMNQQALQIYNLIAAQHPAGGLRDKPSASPDYYHSCYVLSGFSIAQHNAPYSIFPFFDTKLPKTIEESNRIKSVNPLYNIAPQAVFGIKAHFDKGSILV